MVPPIPGIPIFFMPIPFIATRTLSHTCNPTPPLKIAYRSADYTLPLPQVYSLYDRKVVQALKLSDGVAASNR